MTADTAEMSRRLEVGGRVLETDPEGYLVDICLLYTSPSPRD